MISIFDSNCGGIHKLGFSGVTLDTLLLKVRKKDKWIVLFDYFRSDIEAGPSGLAMISLQKQDSLLVFLNIMGS
jgi:hypothetical protein